MQQFFQRTRAILALGLFPLGLFLLALPLAWGQTSATQMKVVRSKNEPGILHYEVTTDPNIPLGTDSPRLGLKYPTIQAENPASAPPTGGVSPYLVNGNEVWLQWAAATNPSGPYPDNDEMSVAQNGQEIVVAGALGTDKGLYYSPTSGDTWYYGAIGNYVGTSDISVMASRKFSNTFYTVSLREQGTTADGILIRQSTNGGATWPSPDASSNSTRIYIPSYGADYPQAVVDNNDRIWVYWKSASGSKWAIIKHTANGVAFEYNPAPVVLDGLALSGLPKYEIHRLACDPATNRVYAIGLQQNTSAVYNIYAARMVENQSGNNWAVSGLANENTSSGVYYNQALPGMRSQQLRNSGAVYNGYIYVAWPDLVSGVSPAYPHRIKLRRMIDTGTVLANGTLWTFNGSSASSDIGHEWNTPYRVDVVAGNRNPNTIGVSFMAAYKNPNTGSISWNNFRILTSANDGASSWYDTRLSQNYPNWTWVNTSHLEWYRSFIDYSTNQILSTWVEDTPYFNQAFINAITP